MKRRDRPRPDDAIRVVPLLDDGGHGASDADAIAAHDHRFARAAFVEVVAAHGRRVLRPELEDLSHFDAAKALIVALSAPRAEVAFNRDPQIVKALELFEVSIGLESEMVVALFVRTACEVEGALETAVDVNGHVQGDRADEP